MATVELRAFEEEVPPSPPRRGLGVFVGGKRVHAWFAEDEDEDMSTRYQLVSKDGHSVVALGWSRQVFFYDTKGRVPPLRRHGNYANVHFAPHDSTVVWWQDNETLDGIVASALPVTRSTKSKPKKKKWRLTEHEFCETPWGCSIRISPNEVWTDVAGGRVVKSLDRILLHNVFSRPNNKDGRLETVTCKGEWTVWGHGEGDETRVRKVCTPIDVAQFEVRNDRVVLNVLDLTGMVERIYDRDGKLVESIEVKDEEENDAMDAKDPLDPKDPKRARVEVVF